MLLIRLQLQMYQSFIYIFWHTSVSSWLNIQKAEGIFFIPDQTCIAELKCGVWFFYPFVTAAEALCLTQIQSTFYFIGLLP